MRGAGASCFPSGTQQDEGPKSALLWKLLLLCLSCLAFSLCVSGAGGRGARVEGAEHSVKFMSVTWGADPHWGPGTCMEIAQSELQTHPSGSCERGRISVAHSASRSQGYPYDTQTQPLV